MTRVAFLGTPGVALPSLQVLAALAEVPVVVSRPDAPTGRGRKLTPSPVTAAASELGILVEHPTDSRQIAPILKRHAPLDAAVVVAFGMLLRPDALAVPGAGHVNVHFSVLPRWRGAAPVARALLAGDEASGVTLIRLDEGLDTGPILATRATKIGHDETAGELATRLATAGADLLEDTLADILIGRALAVPQPATGITMAAKLRPEERKLDPRAPQTEFVRRVRALSPSPGAHALLDGERFRILRARVSGPGGEPGLLEVDQGRLLCGVADGRVELAEVQPAGKQPMSGSAWARGRRLPLGELA